MVPGDARALVISPRAREVALSALSGGVAGWLGKAPGFNNAISGLAQPVQAAIRAAAGSTLTQGIAVLTRLQEEFSWREVRISALAAPFARAATRRLGRPFTRGLVGSLTSSTTRLALGGTVDSTTVIADAFGNAIGNSVVEMSPSRWKRAPSESIPEYSLSHDPVDLITSPELELNPELAALDVHVPPDEHWAAAATEEIVDLVASTQPESDVPAIYEVIVTGRRMSPGQQRVFEMRETLAQLLQSTLDQHRTEQAYRNSVEAKMGYLETAWVGFGGIADNVYQGAKKGAQALLGGATSLYEFNQRLVGAALHLDFEEYFAEWGHAFESLGDKAEVAAAGVKNIATVLADDESRQMLADFAVEYYNTSSSVSATQLLGALPAELLIAAGTAGAGNVVKGAGITQRIGSALGDLARALRAIEIEFVDIDARGLGASQRGSVGLRIGRVEEPRRIVDAIDRADFLRQTRELTPNTIYRLDGFEYVTDARGRPLYSEGALKLDAGGNRVPHQDAPIGRSGRPDDIGFHLGADQFGFIGGRTNVVPGNETLNLRGYASMEREIRSLVEANPGRVWSRFEAVYNTNNVSLRPDRFRITTVVNGKQQYDFTFENSRTGR